MLLQLLCVLLPPPTHSITSNINCFLPVHCIRLETNEVTNERDDQRNGDHEER